MLVVKIDTIYRNLFIGIGLGFLFYIILLITGYSPWGIQSWSGVWIMPLTVYLSLKSYKEHTEVNQFTFGILIKQALKIMLIYCVAYEVLILIVELIFNTQNVEIFIQSQLSQLHENEEPLIAVLGQENFDASISEIKKADIYRLLSNDFFNKILFGLIVSIIWALVLKSKKDELS